MSEERIIWDAEFNISVTMYWLLSGAVILTMTIVGTVIVPFWFILGGFATRHYLASFRCTLTNRSKSAMATPRIRASRSDTPVRGVEFAREI